MKKILFSILFFSLAFIVHAQTKDVYSLLPVQAGTINLTSKSEKVILNDEVKELLNDKTALASYYVVFTPIDGTATPSISDKNSQSFSVLPNTTNTNINKSTSSVDYVVFVKRKVVSLHGNRQLQSN